MVSAVWSQLSTEQKMSNWAWEVAMKLCLHVEAWHHHDFVNPTALQEFSQTIPDINGDPMYFPIVKGLKESCGLAHYLAFVMSKYSHRFVYNNYSLVCLYFTIIQNTELCMEICFGNAL